MTTSTTVTQRRMMLQAIAGIAATSLALPDAQAAARKPVANGKAGDFSFLTGEWKIKNRRLKNDAWDHFDGEATVIEILGGIASIEELRIPARNFSGMGLRLLDAKTRLWADYFVNSQSGALGSEPTWGSFVDGAGTWDADDTDNGKAIIARGVWDQITPTSCRWYQAVSSDDGKTWDMNWEMHWTRR